MGILDTDVREELWFALKDEVLDITLNQVTSSYDPDTRESTETKQSYTCKGWDEEVSEEFVEALNITADDRQIIILQKSLTDAGGNEVQPKNGDEVVVSSTTYEVRNVHSDPADAIWRLVGRA